MAYQLNDTFAKTQSPGNYPDARQRGLALRIGKRKRSWVFKAMHAGTEFSDTLGSYPSMPYQQAALAAADRLMRIENGTWVKGRAGDPEKLTLNEAWEIARKDIANPETAKNYAGHWSRELHRFGKRRVVELTSRRCRVEIIDFHADLIHRRGGYSANAAIKVLVAIIGRARKRYPELDPLFLPRFDWFEERPFHPDLRDDLLRAHHDAIAAEPWLPRRCFHEAIYFTGFRPLTLRRLTWDHVGDGWIRGAHGKTGPIDMPITKQLADILDRCRGFCDTRVFPSPTGRELAAYYVADTPLSARAIRHHFATVAHTRVPEVQAMKLMCHSLGGMRSVYVNVQERELTEAAKVVADELDARRMAL